MKKFGKEKLKEYCRNTGFTSLFGFDILPYLSLVRFDSGEMIVNEGTRPRYLYYIVQGRVKVLVTHENGKVTLRNYLDAPFFIGEIEMLQKQRMAKGVQTVVPCIGFAVDVSRCEDLLMNDNTFLRQLIFYFSRRSVQNNDTHATSNAWPLRNRLAWFILKTSADGIYRQKHTETSEYLGVTYRHLLYVIAEFVDAGRLEKSGRGYKITNRTYLQQLADVMDNK